MRITNDRWSEPSGDSGGSCDERCRLSRLVHPA
ncbi:MAG: hypothetical protein JWN46_3614 [Acidimicrobiales bacterium]|nr:hypothetical protein [Acidimicrobiales bacterium]